MTEQEPAAATAQCRTCGGAIMETNVGWTHVDSRGVLLGWTCSLPHMGIARPDELASPGHQDPGRQDPGRPDPGRQDPGGTESGDEKAGSRRRTTPIPPTSRHSTAEPPTQYPGL